MHNALSQMCDITSGGWMRRGGVKTLQKVWYHIWTAPYKEEVVDIFIWLTLRVSNTGCFNTSLPPLFLQPYCVMVHLKSIYFQNPISIPDYHARFHDYIAIYLLPVLWFICQGQAQGQPHFHEHFQTVFLGWLSVKAETI